MSYHTIIIVGRAGRDPELRYTPTGQAVANLNVASSRKYTGSDGQLVEETIWFHVSVWGKQAENVSQYVKKGQMVLVEGRLRPDSNGNPRTYTRQDGSSGASYDISAQTVTFLSSKAESMGGSGEAPGFTEQDAGDIPF